MSSQKQIKSGIRKFAGHAVSMASYSLPRMIESMMGSMKYISWGVENEYPQMLIDLYNTSPTHRAIMNQKCKYIKGKGLMSDDPKVQAWLDKANRFDYDWTSVFDSLVTDDELLNAMVVEVRQPRKSSEKSYYHMDASKIRLSKDKKSILYSDQWVQTAQKVYDHKYQQEYQKISAPKTKKIPIYDPKVYQPHYVRLYFVRTPGMNTYPLPYYQASLSDIQTDARIPNYNLNEIRNNFALGGTIVFKEGAPQTEDEIKEHKDLMEALFSGDESAGTWRSVFASDPDSAPDIVPHDGNNLADRYTNLKNRVEKSIFIGHEITSQTLFGIPTPGALSQRSELILAYEIFNKQYVDDRRKIALNFIKAICSDDLGIKDPDIQVIERDPIDNRLELTENTIRGVLRPDEIRKYIESEYGLELGINTEMKAQKFQDEGEKFALSLFEKVASERTITGKEVQRFEIQHDEEGKPLQFDANLNDLELQILKLIKENNDISRTQLAEAMKMELSDIAVIVESLQAKRLLSFNGLAMQLTFAGLELDLKDDLPTTKLFYRYTLRSDAPALKPGGHSRPFCEGLMALPEDRNLFTKEEIEGINNQMKASEYADVQNVWLSRGGWYRPPGTDISVPFCRHIWEQVLMVVD